MRIQRSTLLCATALIWLLGCAQVGPSQSHGKATEDFSSRQTQNPDAADKRIDVEGVGATTAADILENYHQNQTTEAQERRQERQRDNGLNDID